MSLIKKCKHKNTQTLTNIHGDLINMTGCRSYKCCIDCGKIIKSDELDNNCKRVNISPYSNVLHHYHLYGETLEDISDGYHSFNDLYYQRMMLFAVICNTYKDKAWKSLKHSDNTMFDGYFIAGIATPEGNYTFHYKLKDWDKFNVKELNNAPKWDGHTEKDVTRLFSLL